MESFTCKKCEKRSRILRIWQSDDPAHVVCEHCRAKNSLRPLPKVEGAPVQWEVIGIVN